MAGFITRTIFKFKEFSRKQKQILHWWKDDSPVKDCDSIIADGAVRSGKTVSMSLSYVNWAMSTHRGQNLIMCGKTIGSLRRNVINPLKVMLWTRGYAVKDHRSDNYLEIRKKNVVNYFYLFGGNDESSQDLIQGITAAGCFMDEVALFPESFVNQATARCSVDGSKLWFNCNPGSAFHFFKINWIDKKEEKKIFYIHFTMNDNPSLSEPVRERYRRMYSGVFYKRYILGQWVISDGVIYDMFSEERHIKENPNQITMYYDYLAVSCDYGTQNPCTFGLFGIKGKTAHQIKSYYYDGRKKGIQKSDSEYAKDMVKFIGDYRQWTKCIIVDPSAASFITELGKSKYNLPQVIKAKNNVLDGIRLLMSYLQNDMFTMSAECEEDKREFSAYVWDSKAAARGVDQPVKEQDHAMDKIRYLIYTLFHGGLDFNFDKVKERNEKLNTGKGFKLRRSKSF